MDALLNTSSPGAPSKLTVGKNIFVGTQSLQKRFGPLTSLETDLLNVASVIYAADLAVKRNEREDFVRTIKLELPVINLAAFNGVKVELEQILRVLSCDNWTLSFQAAGGTPEPNRKWPKTKGTTLLFSGGLDSFAGACELLQHGEETFLVSHITRNRPVADSQKKLVSEIERYYRVTTSHMPLMVSCRTNRNFPFPQDSLREETQRTRSFLFVVIAAVAARMNGSRRILVMAENGQFAIHLPLTAARVGAFSTHTAHPEFLQSMETVLRGLLLCPDLTLRNPFEHKTKSEVVELVPAKLRPVIEKSISCWMTARLTQYTHCGECIPCISRRLALEAHQLKFKEYKRDMFRADIGSLPPDDAGKRNLTDMLEFIARFHGPHAIKNEQDLAVEFPELFNSFVNKDKTIAMYRRFAKSATQVLAAYPAISGLLK